MLKGKKVGVIDRAISSGSQAPLYLELSEALTGTKAEVSSFYGGLGGRGLKRSHVRELFNDMKSGPQKKWIASFIPDDMKPELKEAELRVGGKK